MFFIAPTPVRPAPSPSNALLHPLSPIRPPVSLPHTPTAVIHHERPPSSAPQRTAPRRPSSRILQHTPQQIDALRIRHILVNTEQLADELFSTLTAERTNLADLAPSLSLCAATRGHSGDLGWWWTKEAFPRDAPDAAVDSTFLQTALSVRPNTLHRARSEFGWHLFVVEQLRYALATTHLRTPTKHNPNRSSRKGNDDDVLPPVPRTYAIQTMGCQMNRSDSERMAGQLEHMGLREVDDAERAAVLVINTCNIREHAETKVYSYLGRHVTRKRKFPRDVTLCVSGCVAQQEGESMLRRIPELDLAFGPQYVNRLDELLDDVARNGCQVAATDPLHILEDISKPKRQSDVTAWVNVMYGCGESCTFCTVGNVVRTVEQSRTLDAVRAEVQSVADAGIREVVLLGQNIDAYGRDMFPKRNFAELLRHIHDVDGIDRIRFTTSHPRYISETLVKTCAELPKIMPFFHIPPQSGDDHVLKEMRRGYTADYFVKVVERIRSHIPDAAICGDMIVGFPRETEEQFENSLKLMETIKFDVMNTAAYSRRPQTPAAEMDGQIEDDVKADRLARMNRVVTEHALERSSRYVGRTEQVLVEHENPRDASQVVGRTETNRPVHFVGDFEALKGKIVPVKISKAFAFSLQGEAVGAPR